MQLVVQELVVQELVVQELVVQELMVRELMVQGLVGVALDPAEIVDYRKGREKSVLVNHAGGHYDHIQCQ